MKQIINSSNTATKDISRYIFTVCLVVANNVHRLSNLLTTDAGRRRFTMNLQTSFKEVMYLLQHMLTNRALQTPQQVMDNMSFDTMLELFNTMLSEMNFDTEYALSHIFRF